MTLKKPLIKRAVSFDLTDKRHLDTTSKRQSDDDAKYNKG